MSALFKSILKDALFVRSVVCNSCLERGSHQYRKTITWENTIQFSEFLTKSVVYHDNGLLVLNKPYGVSFSRSSGSNNADKSSLDPEESVFNKQKKNNVKNSNSIYATSGIVSDSLNLVDCLPYLKQQFGYNKLYIARVPEKYVSGVAILTTSPELVEHINKGRAHAPTGKDKYLAVVVGVPRYASGTIKLGFKLEQHPKKGKRVVLLQKWANRAYKRGEIRIGTFHHQLISSGYNDLASLVQINVDLRKYHAYRVFCADYLHSPVLGDNLFGSRVQTLMGVPTTVHHFNDVADTPQRLPQEMYRHLGLTSGEASIIPIHVHLEEMLLPRFFQKGQSLRLRAPVPPHFLWTCERLGLTQQADNRLLEQVEQ
ncbi:tRNA pseudouridine synthesis [Homalodisca vitripennis]|nr:tRNA pseudouridine synthesis [Homalodisca vitripennis]